MNLNLENHLLNPFIPRILDQLTILAQLEMGFKNNISIKTSTLDELGWDTLSKGKCDIKENVTTTQ